MTFPPPASKTCSKSVPKESFQTRFYSAPADDSFLTILWFDSFRGVSSGGYMQMKLVPRFFHEALNSCWERKKVEDALSPLVPSIHCELLRVVGAHIFRFLL